MRPGHVTALAILFFAIIGVLVVSLVSCGVTVQTGNSGNTAVPAANTADLQATITYLSQNATITALKSGQPGAPAQANSASNAPAAPAATSPAQQPAANPPTAASISGTCDHGNTPTTHNPGTPWQITVPQGGGGILQWWTNAPGQSQALHRWFLNPGSYTLNVGGEVWVYPDACGAKAEYQPRPEPEVKPDGA